MMVRFSVMPMLCLACAGLVGIVDQAVAYDDPAVAVCEYAWTRGNDLPEGSYRRESAVIEGDTVKLVISYFPLNIRPKSIQANCTFELTGPRELTIKRSEASTITECKKRTEEAREILKNNSLMSAAGDKANTTIKNCEFALQTAYEEKRKFDDAITYPLSKLRIYPINPADTDLKVVDPRR